MRKLTLMAVWALASLGLNAQELNFVHEGKVLENGATVRVESMKDMGGALREHRVVYQLNPILLWCLTNTAKKSTNKDGIESIQPVKCSSNRRIDGTVSLLNAWVGYSNHTEEYMSYLR